MGSKSDILFIFIIVMSSWFMCMARRANFRKEP